MCGSEVFPKPQGLSSSDEALLTRASQVLASCEAPPSPCIGVCRMSDDTRLCAGCWRSLDELAGWGQSCEEHKRIVWERIAQRLQASRQSSTHHTP
jgi:uncharacterized protein